MAECTAMLRPRMDPVSDLETTLVIAAVRMALIKHKEHVRGNRRIKKSVTCRIKV